MALSIKLKLAALKAELKAGVAAARKDHGVWMKYKKAGDHRNGHGAEVKWKNKVRENQALKAQIQALEQQLAGPATTASRMVAASIGAFEGGRSADGLFHVYFDKAGGVWTIGFGHTGSDTGPNSRPLTLDQATALLLHDLDATYAPAVARTLKSYGFKATQKEFDALVSFVYNVGPGTIERGHTIGDALASGNRAATRSDFLIYDHAANGQVLPGLQRRRAWESQLFGGGTYQVS